jgi:predicted enzyme related to lactoylglutathione lyase
MGPGAFCWVDLAATDAGLAQRFYASVFGWTFRDQHVLGGHFTRCQVDGRDVGSLYPLTPAQRAHGVPSHWTPYIAVDGVDAALRRVVACGGRQLVAPFDVPGTARISLVEDAVGAIIGLWRPIGASPAALG